MRIGSSANSQLTDLDKDIAHDTFTVFPAIDLRRGQVVRLQEGDPARQTDYDADPAAAARRWLAAGAAWLHVVNLDGAFGEGGTANRQALAAILDAAGETGASVQFGGGLRTPGGDRSTPCRWACSGSSSGQPRSSSPSCSERRSAAGAPERIAAGLDARGGLVQVRGWQAEHRHPGA